MITLSVQQLKKRIGNKEIIKDISFEVSSGEVFGFLGPNGAGKTTTIRMLVGLIKPTAGSITICGFDIQRNYIEAMRCVGCIVENPEMYMYLSGRQNLEHFSRMLGPVDHERINEVIQLVEMNNRIEDKVRTYSLGMRQRLGIAQALLGRPKLLILDEPTNGLDPAGIKEMRIFIRKLAEEEHISVMVSSHMLGEVQMICDRVAIISHGKIVTSTSIHQLSDKETARVEWIIHPVEDGIRILNEVALELIELGGNKVTCVLPVKDIDTMNMKLIEYGVRVSGIRRLDATLEDLFLELTGEDHIE